MDEPVTVEVVDLSELEEMAELFAALAHPIRLAILCFIPIEGRIEQKRIVEAAMVTPSAVSQHLAVLRHRGLIHRQREGTRVFVSRTDHWFLIGVEEAFGY